MRMSSWHGHRTMIFGFLRQNLKTQAVAVAFSMAWQAGSVEPADDAQVRGWLAVSRRELSRCFIARGDALSRLADVVLCTNRPVQSLAGLSLVAEHRRGHGALYDAVNHGRIGSAPGW